MSEFSRTGLVKAERRVAATPLDVIERRDMLRVGPRKFEEHLGRKGLEGRGWDLDLDINFSHPFTEEEGRRDDEPIEEDEGDPAHINASIERWRQEMDQTSRIRELIGAEADGLSDDVLWTLVRSAVEKPLDVLLGAVPKQAERHRSLSDTRITETEEAAVADLHATTMWQRGLRRKQTVQVSFPEVKVVVPPTPAKKIPHCAKCGKDIVDKPLIQFLRGIGRVESTWRCTPCQRTRQDSSNRQPVAIGGAA